MRRGPVALAGLVILAMLLRVGAIGFTHAWTLPAEENRLIARNLRAGRGFTFTQYGVTGPTAVRGPAYPLLLTVLRPDWMTFVLGFNVVCGGASVVAAYRLAQCLSSPPPLAGGGRGRGTSVENAARSGNPSPYPLPQGEGGQLRDSLPWIAAALFAVWPTQVFAATVSQGLSIAILLALIAIALLWRRDTLGAAGGGLVAGVAALTEPVLALPLLLVALLAGDGKQIALRVLAILAMIAVVGPWLYRNAIVFDGPTAITTNAWPDAFQGNGPHASGTRHSGDGSRVAQLNPHDFDALKVPEADRSRVFRAWTMDWIKANPLAYLRLCVSRIRLTLWDDDTHPLASLPYSLARLIAGSCGIVMCIGRTTITRRLILPMTLGVLCMTAFTVADARTGVLMDVPQLLAIAAACARPNGDVGAAA